MVLGLGYIEEHLCFKKWGGGGGEVRLYLNY